MKLGKLTLLLAGISTCGSDLSAVTASSGNPYGAIVERNLFALKDPPPPEPVKQPEAPASKVDLVGIMTIFGKKQGLFSVQDPPQQGQPAKPPQTHILAEGERVGDLEILEIDDKAGTAKINNGRGATVVEFKKGGPPSGPAVAANPGLPAASGSGAPIPAAPMPSVNFTPTSYNQNNQNSLAASRSGSSANPGAGGYQMPTRTIRTTQPELAGLPVGVSQAQYANQQPAQPLPQINPEVQEVMIEANKLAAKDAGDEMHKIFPPTSLSPLVEAEEGGSAPPAPGPPGFSKRP